MAMLKVDVEGLVKATEAALAEALTTKGGMFVQEIVRQALSAKADNYGRETVLQAALKKVIRAAAEEQIRAWVLANGDTIGKMVAQECVKCLSPEFVARNVIEQLRQVTTTVAPFCAEDEDSDNG